MLHRRFASCVLAALCLAGTAFSQIPQVPQTPDTQEAPPTPRTMARTKAKEKTPRALAVVEWGAAGQPRLVPLTVLIDGRYYNAAIYLADPVPLALDSGTVYQVEQAGDPTGFFTVNAASQQQDGSWVGVGSYRTNEQIAAAAAAAAKKKKSTPKAKATDEGPPKLHRPGSKDESGSSKPSSTSDSSPSADTSKGQSSSSDSKPADDNRPVLKRPGESSSDQTSQASSPDSDEDEDRPRLKHSPEEKPETPDNPSASAPVTGASQPSAPTKEDSAHPVLRRGGDKEQADALPGGGNIPKGASPIAGTPSLSPRRANAPPEPKRVMAAISDAGGPEPKDYTWIMKPEDKQSVTASAEKMALAALNAYAQAHNGHASQLQNVQVRIFDLTTSNEPYLVLTASAENAPLPASPRSRTGAAKAPAPAPARPLTYYVTFVARQDYDGNLRKVFTLATDTDHLDAWPRLQLVDAVDVNGDGRGELLFRATSDTDSSYIVYSVSPGQMTQLFNSAALQR